MRTVFGFWSQGGSGPIRKDFVGMICLIGVTQLPRGPTLHGLFRIVKLEVHIVVNRDYKSLYQTVGLIRMKLGMPPSNQPGISMGIYFWMKVMVLSLEIGVECVLGMVQSRFLQEGQITRVRPQQASCHNGGSSHNWNQATGDNDARTDIGYGFEKTILFKAG